MVGQGEPAWRAWQVRLATGREPERPVAGKPVTLRIRSGPLGAPSGWSAIERARRAGPLFGPVAFPPPVSSWEFLEVIGRAQAAA